MKSGNPNSVQTCFCSLKSLTEGVFFSRGCGSEVVSLVMLRVFEQNLFSFRQLLFPFFCQSYSGGLFS